MNNVTIRPATESDFDFAFAVKKRAFGPYIKEVWGWDEEIQIELHKKVWSERTMFIITKNDTSVGTLSYDVKKDHIYLGQFFIMPEFQKHGIGSVVLELLFADSLKMNLPIRLRYLNNNPAGELYKRNGFKESGKADEHYIYLERQPGASRAVVA
jgi:GNAT superfamily N-acetyltransferase